MRFESIMLCFQRNSPWADPYLCISGRMRQRCEIRPTIWVATRRVIHDARRSITLELCGAPNVTCERRIVYSGMAIGLRQLRDLRWVFDLNGRIIKRGQVVVSHDLKSGNRSIFDVCSGVATSGMSRSAKLIWSVITKEREQRS